jgi:hypothetical protein
MGWEMWSPFRKLLAKSRMLGSLFGDVLFQTQPLKGQSEHSTFQWQVKKGLDERSLFVCIKLRPDGFAGPEGSPTTYTSFDLATALQIRADLDECIANARHFAPDNVRS